MKKIFKYAYLALAGMIAITVASCSDSYKYDGRGDWDATDGYANIYFAITDSTLELDPADPTVVNVTVSRRNTQGALTVPFEIHENTDDVFTVTDAVFADGQAETDITLSFPNAAVGKPYTLEITSSDPSIVSQYSAGAIYTIQVTRVKWNDVGFYYKETGDGEKEKVEGWAMYTDDIITTFFGVGNMQFPTRIQEREDMKGYFRLINTYGEEYIWNEPGDWDATKDYYIYIDATDPTKVYIPEFCETGMDWGYGMIGVYSLAAYYLNRDDAESAAGNYGTYENGIITFPSGSLLISMADYNDGGLYTANGSGAFSLVINPDLSPYNADMTSKEDFEWEEVFDGVFTSQLRDIKKNGVKLYVGTCINNTDSCDVRFAKEYGTAYKIESPYAEGYDLYFAVDSTGAVTLPEDLKYQNTGWKMGSDVYAVISPAASTFTDLVITLKITFQTKPDANGNYVEFGSAEEVLSNITWSKVGTGTYTYTSFFADYDEETDEDIPYADGPLDVLQRDDDPTIFKVTDWGYGGEFVFTWDGKDKVTVPASYTGYESSYGSVYVSDFPTFDPDEVYEDWPCSYDADTQTFTFNVIYWCSAGYFAFSEETLQVTWDASGTSRSAKVKSLRFPKVNNLKLNKSKKFSWFGKGTKTNVKSKKTLMTPSKAPLFAK